jgi:hypothetical protein
MKTKQERTENPPEAEREHTEWRLRERIKELTCLHAFGTAVENGGSIDTILENVVKLLPAAWQFPDDAVGRIICDQSRHQTDGFPNSHTFASVATIG